MSLGSLQWWPAPAKLNLCLHITGVRVDGYHELQTIFQIIDLQDELAFELESSGSVLRVDDAAAFPGELATVAPENDLCVRAALALRKASGRAKIEEIGVRIRIRKNIPIGSGLGGGSSDAATTLCVLNQLWGLGLSEDALSAIGLTLGADVPLFVRGFSSLGEGIGELLTPLDLPRRSFLVLHPRVSIPTSTIFQASELTRNSHILTIPALLASGGRNDCEPVVRARFPEVAEAFDWLSGFGVARLTGTGSCLFMSFETNAEAQGVAEQVPDIWRAWVARGLSVSPLRMRLEKFLDIA